MAPTSLLVLSLLLYLHSPSDGQTVIGSSSSFSFLEELVNSSPHPTKQTVQFWPSLPSRGRSDVPIRPTIRDRLVNTNPLQPGQRLTRPTVQPTSSFICALSTQNLSTGPILTQPTASRPRTDTASLAFSRAYVKGDSTTKVFTPLLPTLPSSAVAENSVDKPTEHRNPEEGSVKGTEDVDLQGLGSGGIRTETGESAVPLPTLGNELAQYRPRAQTATSEGLSPKITNVKMAQPDSQPEKPPVFVVTTAIRISTTTQTETSTTPLAVVTQATPRNIALTGDLTANTPSAPKQAGTLPRFTTITTTTGTSDKQRETTGLQVNNQSSSKLNITTQQVTTTVPTTVPTTQERVKTPAKTMNHLNKTTEHGQGASPTNVQLTKTGTSMFITTGVVAVTRSRFAPTYQTSIYQRNRSILLGHPHQAPRSTYNPVPSPSIHPSPNATLLYWGDLSRTLTFAWELHVYGSASLFLLLFAGAALGLTLSPGMNCPHRGALALANALLFVAGGIRAALFLIDPYGTRKFLPRPAVTALYNLPLHLLIWTQAALALLALRVTGVSLFPSTLERPPLVAVLAVLQCTLLLAADLLSPALSPVVPVTLQVLSLFWGLVLCLCFLCYVFPRIRCPSIPHPGLPEEARRKVWTGSRRIAVILGRVLAMCAVLGTLCCGLHIHATLWLYGLLGDWTHFNWGWWLVHFWARLLELAWGFSLLLLASWVFWRPEGCRGRDDIGTGDGRAAGDLPSPGQSGGSTHRHNCWSKIVQSLRGKPCRKSDSNGTGGGGGPGELPNNWAGQDRSGADISKSLIRNQNHDQPVAPLRCVKDNNRGRNHRGHSAERGIGISDGSTGSLLRLQTFGRPPHRSVSGSLDQDRDTSVSLYEFDLRPPSPIDLTRSIDEALHREHLLEGGSLFHPMNQASLSPSPGSGVSQGPWLRRNSDPQLLSESSEAPTESSMPLGGSVLSSVPSRQVTAPPTPSHQGHRWAGNGAASVPSSVSCPVSLRPSRTSTGRLEEDGVDDTRPFITPDSERVRGRAGKPVGSRSYLEVSRHDDSASVSSEIIDL